MYIYYVCGFVGIDDYLIRYSVFFQTIGIIVFCFNPIGDEINKF